jgi:tetracycline repressor-like protein
MSLASPWWRWSVTGRRRSDRSTVNAWHGKRIRNAVRAIGRSKLIIAGVSFAEWNTVLAQQLAGGPMTPEQVADVLADTLSARPLLCDLFARVSSTLEHNVSPRLGRDFKLRMLDHTQQLASMIAAALTHVFQEQALEMVAGGYALVAGLWPMSTLSPNWRRCSRDWSSRTRACRSAVGYGASWRLVLSV